MNYNFQSDLKKYLIVQKLTNMNKTVRIKFPFSGGYLSVVIKFETGLTFVIESKCFSLGNECSGIDSGYTNGHDLSLNICKILNEKQVGDFYSEVIH